MDSTPIYLKYTKKVALNTMKKWFNGDFIIYV